MQLLLLLASCLPAARVARAATSAAAAAGHLSWLWLCHCVKCRPKQQPPTSTPTTTGRSGCCSCCSVAVALVLSPSPFTTVFPSLSACLSLSRSCSHVCLYWPTFVLTGKKGEYALKFMPRRRDIKFSHGFSLSSSTLRPYLVCCLLFLFIP